MRIVVKNIQNLQEDQVKKILSEWIPVNNDPACYYTLQDGVGSFYANIPGDILPAMAADFNEKAQEKLGAGSYINLSLVQSLPVSSSFRNTPKIRDDPVFCEYMKNPSTWTLKSSQPKRRQPKSKEKVLRSKPIEPKVMPTKDKGPEPVSREREAKEREAKEANDMSPKEVPGTIKKKLVDASAAASQIKCKKKPKTTEQPEASAKRPQLRSKQGRDLITIDSVVNTARRTPEVAAKPLVTPQTTKKSAPRPPQRRRRVNKKTQEPGTT